MYHLMLSICHFPSRLLLAVGLGLALGSSAHAATFNVEDSVQHTHWQSMSLVLGDERHFRAVETHSYSDASLSLNATPGVCDLPWLEMRVELDERQGESRAVNLVPARLRVDDATRHESMAEFITERGDNGFYTHFYLNDVTSLIEEMREGDAFYLGFEQGEQAPWFMTFSLQGAEAAIERMQAACHASTNASIGTGRENR